MKRILLLCAVTLVAGVVAYRRHARLPDRFGTFEDAPVAVVADVLAKPKAYAGKTIGLEGVVRDQCTTMGCYFSFIEGEKSLRVELAEIAMHAPRGKNGHRVRVEGQVVPYQEGWQLLASFVEFR